METPEATIICWFLKKEKPAEAGLFYVGAITAL
jgi:hypothetical protein